MSSNRIKLWINAETSVLYDNWQSNSIATSPVFTQGDNVEVELHFVRWTLGSTRSMYEVELPAGSTIRLAIGKIDTAATSGTFNIEYDLQSVDVAYNATALVIQNALNALATIAAAGGVTVSKTTNSLLKINFNVAGVNETLIVNGIKLSPPCATKVITLVAGAVGIKGSYAIKLKQAPVVYNDVWEDIEQPSISTTTLISNRGKRVSISPEPKSGSWSLTGTASVSSKVSALNHVPEQTELDAFWTEETSRRLSVTAAESDFLAFQYDVRKVDTYTWDFGVREDYAIPAGYAMPFAVSGTGITGFIGKTATIDFNTAEVEYLLDGAVSASVILEIEIEQVGGAKQTVVQTVCTIKNDLIDQFNFSPISYDAQGIAEAPVDGIPYVRRDAAWVALTEIDGGTF
jgi:hypothetical protein